MFACLTRKKLGVFLFLWSNRKKKHVLLFLVVCLGLTGKKLVLNCFFCGPFVVFVLMVWQLGCFGDVFVVFV